MTALRVGYTMVGFDHLDDDVLVHLFELILQADKPGGDRIALVPLSSTCKWPRRLSKPFIFHRIHRTGNRNSPASPGIFPPSIPVVLCSASLSPIMSTQSTTKLTYYSHRYLTIMDCCMDRGLGRDKLNTPFMDHDTPSYLPHLYACRVSIGPVIRHILQQMPSLTGVSLSTHLGVVHGPTWTFLRLALSLPRLREFEMIGLTFCPVVLPTETLELEAGACPPPHGLPLRGHSDA